MTGTWEAGVRVLSEELGSVQAPTSTTPVWYPVYDPSTVGPLPVLSYLSRPLPGSHSLGPSPRQGLPISGSRVPPRPP